MGEGQSGRFGGGGGGSQGGQVADSTRTGMPIGGLARFTNDLIPIKINYASTSLANLQGLIQYNRQASTISSNIRLALLNRSGTGLFLVYNDRRDTSDFTVDELLERSFIVKYTRLFGY